MPDQAELQAMRIAAGLTVDAATAPIIWDYADTSDPYGDFPFNPAEACIGRENFARAPDGMWISFQDLPEATTAILYRRMHEHPEDYWLMPPSNQFKPKED